HVGCSNLSATQLQHSLEMSRECRLIPYVTCQLPYNLLDRAIESQVLSVARQWGIGILPCFPLAAGLLTGKYTSTSQAHAMAGSVRSQVVRGFAERFLMGRNLRMVARLQAFADASGWGLAQMAIAMATCESVRLQRHCRSDSQTAAGS